MDRGKPSNHGYDTCPHPRGWYLFRVCKPEEFKSGPYLRGITCRKPLFFNRHSINIRGWEMDCRPLDLLAKDYTLHYPFVSAEQFSEWVRKQRTSEDASLQDIRVSQGQWPEAEVGQNVPAKTASSPRVEMTSARIAANSNAGPQSLVPLPCARQAGAPANRALQQDQRDRKHEEPRVDENSKPVHRKSRPDPRQCILQYFQGGNLGNAALDLKPLLQQKVQKQTGQQRTQGDGHCSNGCATRPDIGRRKSQRKGDAQLAGEDCQTGKDDPEHQPRRLIALESSRHRQQRSDREEVERYVGHERVGHGEVERIGGERRCSPRCDARRGSRLARHQSVTSTPPNPRTSVENLSVVNENPNRRRTRRHQ